MTWRSRASPSMGLSPRDFGDRPRDKTDRGSGQKAHKVLGALANAANCSSFACLARARLLALRSRGFRRTKADAFLASSSFATRRDARRRRRLLAAVPGESAGRSREGEARLAAFRFIRGGVHRARA